LQAKSSALQPFENSKLQEFIYDLPEDKIAVFPKANREESLLLVRRSDGSISRDHFRNLVSYLDEGSHLVFNNSRVIPARLIFTKPTGSKIELFCLAPVNPSGYDHSLSSRSACIWECIAGNLKKFKGDELQMNAVIGQKNLLFRAEKVTQIGNLVHIRFSWQDNQVTFAEILSAVGKTPLPPYIKRDADENDR